MQIRMIQLKVFKMKKKFENPEIQSKNFNLTQKKYKKDICLKVLKWYLEDKQLTGNEKSNFLKYFKRYCNVNNNF